MMPIAIGVLTWRAAASALGRWPAGLVAAVAAGVVVGSAPAVAAPAPEPTTAAPGTGCATPVDQIVTSVSWAQLRLAPDAAWPSGRGRGIAIGVIGSGVDSAAPALAGQVAAGADIVTGKSFANTDCLGKGTEMAGVAVARSRPGSDLVGIAPEATVFPVRIEATDGPLRSAQLSLGLQVAVSAGADVVMIAGGVDLTDADVAGAVRAATARDVVVVVAADQLVGDGRIPGMLRVGAVDAANRLVGNYQPDTVDVLAPGSAVVTLSANGSGEVIRTGSHLSVAFVAGLAALVRSSAAGLSAVATAEQIQRTADGLADVPPDPISGWGLINPGRAVQVQPDDVGEGVADVGEDVVDDGAAPSTGSLTRTDWRLVLIGLVLAGSALAGVLIAGRRWRTSARRSG
ncbi:subtilase family protein [Micromonospora sp. Llam0]|uniref:S8 family serine peptidase n=1 Tax=Micromonospora sp. Llam0 TaxID=2485143 RepID=UPI000F490D4E|nr:S8 family serine peptidase [Micromonospora sp. Llam0]ROO63223.1 subtilase family protein [Micromonospora sp. Llam0]